MYDNRPGDSFWFDGGTMHNLTDIWRSLSPTQKKSFLSLTDSMETRRYPRMPTWRALVAHGLVFPREETTETRVRTNLGYALVEWVAEESTGEP